MANYDLRTPIDYKFGQLTAGVTSLDTTLTSSAFTSLPSDLSSTKYTPITLADDSLGVYETVWLTGHSAGSSAVTVIRGREGTSARAWATGAVWRCAPTVRDTMPVLTRATLPSDGHLGMRVQLSDESAVVERTSVGWAATVGGGSTGRRHSWFQTAGPVGSAANLNITGLGATAGNGSIASYSAGGLLLNRAGLWSLMLSAYSDSPQPGMNLLGMTWTNGAFVGGNEYTQIHSRNPNAAANSGQLWMWLPWTGYVNATQAAIAIVLKVNQINNAGASISYNYLLAAEYLGG